MPEEPKVSKCDTFTGQVQTMSLECLVMDVNNLTDRLNAITQENKILVDRLNKLAQDKESLMSRLVSEQKENEELKSRNWKLRDEKKLWKRNRLTQALERKEKSLISWRRKCRALKANYKAMSRLETRNQMLNDALKRSRTAKQKQHERFRASYHSLNVTRKSSEVSHRHEIATLKEQIKSSGLSWH